MAVLVRAPEYARIFAALDSAATQRGPAAVHGLAPGLLVGDLGTSARDLSATLGTSARDLSATLGTSAGESGPGWRPAREYADGSALADLVEAARTRWKAGPAAAAALAWKSYAYWVTLPAVLGYATGWVPDVSADNVVVRVHGTAPFLEVGLRTAAGRGYGPLTGYLRRTLFVEHLEPVLDGLERHSRLGRRTLLGSLASAVAYSLTRSADALLPGLVRPTAATLLTALGVADLVEITPDLAVRRKTCCLAFTLPEPKICSGCCVPHLP